MTNKLKDRIAVAERNIKEVKAEKKAAEKLLDEMGKFWETYGISLNTQKLDQHISYLNATIKDETNTLKNAKKALKKIEEAEALLNPEKPSAPLE